MRLQALAFAEAGLIDSVDRIERMPFRQALEYNVRLQWMYQEREKALRKRK